MLERREVAGFIVVFVLSCLIALSGQQGLSLVISDSGSIFIALLIGAALFALAMVSFSSSRRARSDAARNQDAAMLIEEDGLLVEDGPTPDVDELIRRLDATVVLSRFSPVIHRMQPVDLTALLLEQIGCYSPGHNPSSRVVLEGKRTPLITMADPQALTHLVRILISNALTSGTRAVLRLDRGTTALVVHVDDNGPGLPRSEREAVFDRAYHMDILPSQKSNHCAELVSAKQIARAFGGDITVRCSPEGGARFTLRLPLLLEQHAELRAVS